jgi:hypothetical protein
MKSILFLLLFCIPAFGQLAGQLEDQFPEAPEPIKPMPYGGWAHDKAGEPKVSSPWTKKFIIAHSVELAANIFDIESSQHSFARGCVEGGFDGGSGIHRPSRTEMYTQDMISFEVLGTLDWIIQRSHPPKAIEMDAVCQSGIRDNPTHGWWVERGREMLLTLRRVTKTGQWD